MRPCRNTHSTRGIAVLKKNSYRSRFMPPASGSGDPSSTSPWRAAWTHIGLITAVVVILGAIGASAFVFGEMHARKRMGQIVDENQLLTRQLEQVNQEVESVRAQIDSLVGREELLRLRVDLPPVDDQVWEAGVGSLEPREGEAFADARVDDILIAIDHLERRLAITHQSYGEIQQKILADEERLKHIPSIIPLREGRLTDGFGYRRDPFTRAMAFHHGADFSAPRGTPVYATADGTVKRVYRAPGYGKMVEVDHGMGYSTIYGHLKQAHVRRGQTVTRGEMIAEVGNTGRSTAPHLHYEVRIEGSPVDPLDYFYEGYQMWANR